MPRGPAGIDRARASRHAARLTAQRWRTRPRSGISPQKSGPGQLGFPRQPQSGGTRVSEASASLCRASASAEFDVFAKNSSIHCATSTGEYFAFATAASRIESRARRSSRKSCGSKRAYGAKASRLRCVAVRPRLAAHHDRHVGVDLRPKGVIRRRRQMRRGQQGKNAASIRHGRLHRKFATRSRNRRGVGGAKFL